MDGAPNPPIPVTEVTNAATDSVTDAVTNAELKSLMLRARDDHDDPLRRLIVSYLMLRRVTAEVITLVSAREGGASVASTPLLRRARELSAIEGAR